MSLSEERYGRVRRAFIECLDDQAMPLGFQRPQRETLPGEAVSSIDSDHSPFYSAAKQLVDPLGGLSAD